MRTNAASGESFTGIAVIAWASTGADDGDWFRRPAPGGALAPEGMAVLVGHGAIMLGGPAAVPFRRLAQLGAIEAERRVRAVGPPQQGVGDDGAGKRAGNGLLNAARGNRIDRQRRVSQPNGVRRDAIVGKIRRRVDRPHRTDLLGVAAIVHQARAAEQRSETAARARSPARTGTIWDRRTRACCRSGPAAARPRTRRPRRPRSAAPPAGLRRANRHRPRASSLPFEPRGRPEASRRPPASARKSASICVCAPIDVERDPPFRRRATPRSTMRAG